jgi:hypothetical protein
MKARREEEKYPDASLPAVVSLRAFEIPSRPGPSVSIVRETSERNGASRRFPIGPIGDNTGGERLAAHLAPDTFFSNDAY